MADTKITGLTADTSPSSSDIVPTVKDPGGTPLNRKVTLVNLVKGALGMSAKGDLATYSTTPTKLGVGADGTVLTAASGETTGLKWESPYYPGSSLQRLTRTAGNFTLARNTATHTEISSLLRLTLAASIGDVLLIGLIALVDPTSGANNAIDSATIVSGAIVNQCSPGSYHEGHYYCSAALDILTSNPITYVVVSGDISGGNVTVSPTFMNNSGGSADGTLFATTTHALTYWVMNMKH